MAVWNILRPFGNLVAIWYIFPRLGICIVSRKIWQPWLHLWRPQSHLFVNRNSRYVCGMLHCLSLNIKFGGKAYYQLCTKPKRLKEVVRYEFWGRFQVLTWVESFNPGTKFHWREWNFVSWYETALLLFVSWVWNFKNQAWNYIPGSRTSYPGQHLLYEKRASEAEHAGKSFSLRLDNNKSSTKNMKPFCFNVKKYSNSLVEFGWIAWKSIFQSRTT
jgi:hypothetical protein